MEPFLRKFGLFGLLILVLDLPFRWVMPQLPKLEYDWRLRRVIEGHCTEDLLVFGSSRAARGVIPARITRATGITAYNLGYPGASIAFQEFVLRQVLRSKKWPRIVLLVVDDPSELIATKAVNFRLDRAYPLAGDDEVNKEICLRTGKSRWLTELLASYRIKESLPMLWTPQRPDRFDTVYSDGSMTSLLRAPGMDTARFGAARRYRPEQESAELRDTFIRFVDACAERNIRLVIVHPPDLRAPSEGFIARIEELTHDKAISYRYNAEQPAYSDANYYYDASHLNRHGAIVFSDELGTWLANER
ncbi:MAG: hypothetical protein IPM49_16890 [Flavobacteriales bacterium]|nr:hypothetical protein [Flavobacteriales bacterium]